MKESEAQTLALLDKLEGSFRLNSSLRLLWDKCALSINDLMACEGVSSSTATRLLRKLTELGLARRGLDRIEGPGRPMAIYERAIPDPLVACYVDGSWIWAGIVERDLSIKVMSELALTRTGDVSVQVERIQNLICSLDGFDRTKRVVISLNSVTIEGRSLTSSVVPNAQAIATKLLGNQLGRPVQHCTPPLTVGASRKFQGDETVSDLFFYQVADGVAAHAQIAGRMFMGASGFAGEVGHLVVQRQGPLCGCGRRGCLEALVSGPAIQQQMVELLEQSRISTLNAKELSKASPRDAIDLIWEAWCAGDGLTCGLMDQVLEHLAWGLAVSINMYDPALAAVGGYVLDGHDAWYEEIVRRARPQILHLVHRRLRIEAVPVDSEVLLREIAVLAYSDNPVRIATG